MTVEELREKLEAAEARLRELQRFESQCRQQQEKLSQVVPKNRRLADENLDLRRRNESLLKQNAEIRELLPNVGKLSEVAKNAEALYHLMVDARDNPDSQTLSGEESQLHKVFVDLGLSLWRWRGERPPGIGLDVGMEPEEEEKKCVVCGAPRADKGVTCGSRLCIGEEHGDG